MSDLVRTDDVRDLLVRGYNRSDEEAASAIAALPRAGIDGHPDTLPEPGERGTFADAAYEALDLAEVGRKRLMDLADGPADDARTQEALEVGSRIVIDLARAVVYSLTDVALSADTAGAGVGGRDG